MKNSEMILVTIALMFAIIFIPGIIQIQKYHKEKLLTVTELRIIEAAVLCIKNQECTDDSITLSELYKLNYLENTESNPVTKEIYSDLSSIEKTDNKYIFNPMY